MLTSCKSLNPPNEGSSHISTSNDSLGINNGDDPTEGLFMVPFPLVPIHLVSIIRQLT